MAIVALVLVFNPGYAKTNSNQLNGGSAATASSAQAQKQDCVSSSVRPCIDKGVGNSRFIRPEQKGAENALLACKKNSAPNEQLEVHLETSKCSNGEIAQYCYDGKSNMFWRKFEGQCVKESPPSDVKDCPSLPYLEFVGGVEEVWNDPLYSPHLTSLLHAKSGALYAGGYKLKLVANYWGGYDSHIVPMVYKSADNGKTWSDAELPYDPNFAFGYVRLLKEGSNGEIYATGSALWRSLDNGNTWAVISGSFSSLASVVGVPDMLESKDKSLLAIAYKFEQDKLGVYRSYSEIYKSADNGLTWNSLARFPIDQTYNFIEADDGNLLFSTSAGDIYQYSNGNFVKTLATSKYSYNIVFLKSADGSIYLIADTSDEFPTYPSVIQDRPLSSFVSNDNGKTWTKTGALPFSYIFQWALVGSTDGVIWSASFTPCWRMALYKSEDKTLTWSAVATISPSISSYWEQGNSRITALAEVNGRIYAAGRDSGGVFSTS